jgi:hypothetical protein
LEPAFPIFLGCIYLKFLAPGLIVMTMAQNAFANSSSSLMIAKVQGNIVDFLMAPLSAVDFALGAVIDTGDCPTGGTIYWRNYSRSPLGL